MTGPVPFAAHTGSRDDALLIDASHAEPERFAQIFDDYFAEIHRYVDRRLGADAADDIAAETFLVAFRKRARFDASRGSARSWLYGIATRLVSRHRRNEVRRYRAHARLAPDPDTEGPEERVGARVLAGEVGPRLSSALAKLSAGDRDVLLLVALGDLTYEEVAEALGVAYGTVCSRLNRARKKLRAALGDDHPSGQDTDPSVRPLRAPGRDPRRHGSRDQGTREPDPQKSGPKKSGPKKSGAEKSSAEKSSAEQPGPRGPGARAQVARPHGPRPDGVRGQVGGRPGMAGQGWRGGEGSDVIHG
jgi:RNA polymerase sigma-70 factor (ECF subfamily)